MLSISLQPTPTVYSIQYTVINYYQYLQYNNLSKCESAVIQNILHTVVLHKKDMYMTVHSMAVETLVVCGKTWYTTVHTLWGYVSYMEAPSPHLLSRR